MGGYPSKLDSTDWGKANGGLLKPDETVDGSAPLKASATIDITKQGKLNAREFDVTNVENGDKIIYSTKAVEGTAKYFDLLAADKSFIRVVRADMFSHAWELYKYEAVWDSQAKDEKASAKAGQPLYQLGKFEFTMSQKAGLYYPHEKSGLSTTAVLRLEAVKAAGAKFQTMLPEKEDALVGYWDWQNTAAEHKMRMKLAAGTDVALHVILAVVSNMVRSDQSAGAAAGAGAF